MTSDAPTRPGSRSPLPWLVAGLFGVAVPGIAVLLLARGGGLSAGMLGVILAVALMGVGMLAAAATGRMRTGIALALATGAGLMLLARATGLPALAHLLPAGVAMAFAGVSFAARGALFARSAGARGWWIALFVVAGEAAMLATAAARPGALPEWLLALLPAQWASAALRTALAGTGTLAAGSELLALGGTAAATLLVARLWPRRWPYLVMFCTWLALSALVLHRPAPPLAAAEGARAEQPAPVP